MSNKHIYCGNAKEVTFSSGGSVINASICLDDIPDEFKQVGKNGKAYVKLNIGKLKDGENEYGNTHWVKVDTWKPEPKEEVSF